MSSIRNTILDNLKTAIEAMEDSGTYEINIHRVSMFDENVLKQEPHDLPLIMLIDTGEEQLQVYDGTNYRYSWKVILRGVVSTDTASGLHEELNKMISSVKEFIDSGPSLGSNVLKFRYLETQGNRLSEDGKIADTIIPCEIIYWCVAGAF